MKLRQLVYFNEVIKQDFNISAAARALFTAQPGITRQLQDLAEELGVDLFRHQDKRLIGLTQAGTEIASASAEAIRAVKRIGEIAQAHVSGHQGGLVVVASRHTAGNQLRTAMVRLREEMPTLKMQVYEEEPRNGSAVLIAGDAHFGILTEPSKRHPDLIYFPIEQWRLILVIPRDHPIGRLSAVTLEALASYPLCSYERSARSRQVVDKVFELAGLDPPGTYALSSSALILDYVESGIGIGIVGESSFVPAHHQGLRGIAVSHLFRPLTTDLVIPRKSHISDNVCRFARILDPGLTPIRIREAQRAATA